MPTGESLDTILQVGRFVLLLIAGLAIWALTRHYHLTRLRDDHDKLQKDKSELEGNLEETRRNAEESRQELAERYDRLRATNDETRDRFYRLKAAAQKQREELEGYRLRAATSLPTPIDREAERVRIAELESQLASAQAESQEYERRIEEVTRSDGRIWLRPLTGSVPVFCPRRERRHRIISVLNLKGGVGKTTITANLAATLAKSDPSLLIDLDYQRSLSMLLVRNKDRILLHRAGSSVQHFLASHSHAAKDLLGKVQSLSPEMPDCALLPNSDSRAGSHGADGLEETESRLMLEWLLDRTKADPRFFLREALHDRAIDADYRYVLLDCPPRLSTACVAALAASDYLLIPVVPDAVSTRAAENLLTTLRGLRDLLNPDLKVLAVVANMVKPRQDGLIQAHADALVELKGALLERWDEPILIAKSGIRHDTKFGIAAAELDADKKLRFAIKDEAIAECFDALAKELLQEIQHHESRRTSAVPAQSGARARSGR